MTWDAGDAGCGELVMDLRRRLQRLEPGQELEVIANDRGAEADLPAWCRLTGNVLVSAAPPVYRIRREGV